jgi:hypothetical protein
VLRLYALDEFLHISQLKRISPSIFSTISHGTCPFHSFNVFFVFKFGPVVLRFCLAFLTVSATEQTTSYKIFSIMSFLTFNFGLLCVQYVKSVFLDALHFFRTFSGRRHFFCQIDCIRRFYWKKCALLYKPDIHSI